MIEGTGLTAAEKTSLTRSFSDVSGHQFDGPDNSMSVFRAKDDFLYAFNVDRRLFRTQFLGEGALCSGYPIYGAPRVVSVEFSSEDQWTTKLNYTVELFFNNSMSTGTAGALITSDLAAITGAQSGAFDYIAGSLQSYSREYSVETMAKGAAFGNAYLPSFFSITVNTSAQSLEGTGAAYIATRPVIAGGSAGIGDYSAGGAPIALTGAGSLEEVMSGYLGSAAFSGIKAIHTDSSYSYNNAGGTYSYNDTFVVYGQSGDVQASGLSQPDYPVLDTPSLDIDSSNDNAIVTVTLQGELRGFPSFYGSAITGSETGLGPVSGGLTLSQGMANAQRYLDEASYAGSAGGFQKSSGTAFFSRASSAYSGTLHPAVGLLALQSEPIAQSLSYNIRESTIGYSFTYNNRPPNCFSGALQESINISRGNPAEVFASIQILGRAKGPILQDIGTVTASTTEVSIECVIIPTGNFCTGNIFGGIGIGGGPSTDSTFVMRNFYSGILSDVEANIATEYETYFVTSNTETYDPITGRYSRTKGWTHTEC